MADNFKFGIALSCVVGGLVGYYLLADHLLVMRVLSVLAGLALGGTVAWFTVPGQDFYRFSQDAVLEAKRVVWPSRKETWQTTLAVFALVVVMGIFLWLIDWGFLVAVQRLMGRGE